jgi:hypothetical protein
VEQQVVFDLLYFLFKWEDRYGRDSDSCAIRPLQSFIIHFNQKLEKIYTIYLILQLLLIIIPCFHVMIGFTPRLPSSMSACDQFILNEAFYHRPLTRSISPEYALCDAIPPSTIGKEYWEASKRSTFLLYLTSFAAPLSSDSFLFRSQEPSLIHEHMLRILTAPTDD